MAERKFDYNAIGSAYKSMNADFEVISQLLTQIDNDYKATVNTGADEDALYGDLGSQLLLDWENVSSNFPNFMTNFENWSAVVALAGGNYAQFETDMKGFKEVTDGSYLGVTAQLNGVHTAYTESGVYSQYKNRTASTYASTAASLAGRTTHNVDLSTITYATTDSQNQLTWHRIIGGTMIAGDVVSLILMGTAAYGAATGAGETALVPVEGGGGGAVGTAGTPALEAGSSAPLLTGQVAQPISGLAENVALTSIPADSADFAAFQTAQSNLLSTISAAEKLKATYYTFDSATGIVSFLNSSGAVVGTTSAASNYTFAIAAGAAGL